MRKTPKETYKQILTSFDWSEVGCVVSEDNLIFSVLFDSFIGRLTANGLEDRRFIKQGKYSALNGVNITKAIAQLPNKFKCLLDVDPEDSRYLAYWSERNRLLKEVLASGLDVEFMQQVLDYLVGLKESRDAELAVEAAFEESIAPYREMIEAQETAANENQTEGDYYFYLKQVFDSKDDYEPHKFDYFCKRTGMPTVKQLSFDRDFDLFINRLENHYSDWESCLGWAKVKPGNLTNEEYQESKIETIEVIRSFIKKHQAK